MSCKTCAARGILLCAATSIATATRQAAVAREKPAAQAIT